MKTIKAVVKGIYIANQSDSFVTRELTETELEFGGIRGDRHFGITFPANVRQPMYPAGSPILNRRQISIVAQEELTKIAKALNLPEIKPEWLGANLLIEGVPDITVLPPGSRILFPSGAGLVCESENLPCTVPGEVIQQQFPEKPKLTHTFVKAAYKKRGLVGAVEHPGHIQKGDTVTVYLNDLENPMQ